MCLVLNCYKLFCHINKSYSGFGMFGEVGHLHWTPTKKKTRYCSMMSQVKKTDGRDIIKTWF